MIKKITAFFAAAVMAVCALTSCDDSKFDPVNVEYNTTGFSTPEEVIDAYWDAFRNNDAEKLTSLCCEKEYNILCEKYNVEKDEQIRQIVAAIKEELKNTKDTYSQHEPDQWTINYGEKVDITENYISDDYEKIGMKSAVLFRGVKLENKESGDTLVFLNENVPVIELEDGWYYSMT